MRYKLGGHEISIMALKRKSSPGADVRLHVLSTIHVMQSPRVFIKWVSAERRTVAIVTFNGLAKSAESDLDSLNSEGSISDSVPCLDPFFLSPAAHVGHTDD